MNDTNRVTPNGPNSAGQYVEANGMPPVTTPPLSPGATGSFAQTRQPGSDTSIRPPAGLRQLDGRAQNVPTVTVIDQAALDRTQAEPRPSMGNSLPR